MSIARQAVDLLVTGLIAGNASFLVSGIIPDVSITVGVALACMYYFSRYPWASKSGEKYNEKIDELYDQHLPFD